MTGLADGAVVLLALGLVFWVMLGRPARRREARADRRRHGGRRPVARGRLMPARDRDYLPGSLLALLVVWQLAAVVADRSVGATTFPLAMLCLVLAGAYAYRPDLVGIGLGIIGVTCLVLDRVQGGCPPYTSGQILAFVIGVALAGLLLAGLRLLLTPVRLAERFLIGPVSFWTSPGRARQPGALAGVALAWAGAVDLLDLITRPDVVLPWSARPGSPLVLAAFAAGLAVVAVGLTVLRAFTLSVLGLGVVVANVLVDGIDGAGCVPWGSRIVVTVVFFAVTTMLRRVG